MGKGNGGWKSRCCLYAHLRTSLIYARRTGNQDAKGGLHSVIEPAIALTMSLSRQLPNEWAVSSTYGGRPLLSTGCDMSIRTLMRTTSAPPTSAETSSASPSWARQEGTFLESRLGCLAGSLAAGPGYTIVCLLPLSAYPDVRVVSLSKLGPLLDKPE